ncbi:hypothetical protein APR41_02130 [Salegentibacter salinarum]|uniref:Uncharacterized protein n=1 Tax=Salegentibacter salinarum TaxID=447422 RepID=A0A2N0U469_9FLAO|nr:hypothetical protein [Salegentibacter salinarum]PKD21799.1 hypothetical protein APR41_02130 [Salegentibacter salinarum]SKB33467.1 hypothetical protein SAMN05660903_00133 [Salegentibacter salinarum]
MSHSIFDYNRAWFNHAFDNPDKVKPVHHAIYYFALEHNNRLGWKDKFGFPSSLAMEGAGIKSYNTYIKAFREILQWKFFILYKKSENQYQANIIGLSKFDRSLNESLDKSLMNHSTEHCSSTEQITDSIIIQQTDKQKDQKTTRGFSPPSVDEVYNYMSEKGLKDQQADKESEKFINHYESKGWKVGKSKMKKWEAAASGWLTRMQNFNNSPQKSQQNGNTSRINRQTPAVVGENLDSSGYDFN